MDRRNFLYRAMAGVAGATAGMGVAKTGLNLAHASAKESGTVTYSVKGFTCVTCATGLEVMLLRQKGVMRASASYPEARVVIGFDRSLTSENVIEKFIANCGFMVA